MHSHRRHSTTLSSGKQQNCVSKNGAKSSNSKIKSSVSIQTDNLPGCGGLCNFNAMALDEIKEHYSNTLRFLNKCHEYINSIFKGEVPSVKVQKMLEFRVPEVPNYFNVLEEFLAPNQTIWLKPKQCFTEEKSEEEEYEEQIVFDLTKFVQEYNQDRTTDDVPQIREKSPPRLVKSESFKGPTPNEIKALSTTFEEILKTCNEFENKSIEYLLQHDMPLSDPPKQQESVQKLQVVKHMDNDNQPRGFNLLEYALKTRSRGTSNMSSRSSSDHSLHADRKRRGAKILQEVISNVKKSFTILNAAPQSQCPKKVNELFEKISRESLKHCEGDKIHQNDRKNDEIEISSSESIILSDEEFYRRHLSRSEHWREQMVQSWCRINQPGSSRSQNPRKFLPTKYESEKSPKKSRLKSIPLKLNEKDRTNVDRKILRTIGLFTEKGEIRPDVISMLEQEQSLHAKQSSSKNVKFRTEKQTNVEVRFNNHNMIMSDITSGESSMECGSMSTTGTISDSDLLTIKSQDKDSIKTTRL